MADAVSRQKLSRIRKTWGIFAKRAVCETLEINVSVAVALSDSSKQIDWVSGADVRGRTGQGVGHQSVRVIPPFRQVKQKHQAK